jgi:hypothetical protein
MSDNFKTEYIAELMIAGYTAEEAEELYLSELEEINKNSFLYIDEEDEEY